MKYQLICTWSKLATNMLAKKMIATEWKPFYFDIFTGYNLLCFYWWLENIGLNNDLAPDMHQAMT